MVAVLGAGVGLEVASRVVPDFDIGGFERAVVAGLAIAVLGMLLRPLLVQLAVLLGWVGALLVGLFGQAVVIWLVTLDLTGDDPVADFVAAFLAGWIVAAVSTAALWLFTAGTDDAATASILRRGRLRRRSPVPDPEVPGVVFVQADGVPFPVLQMAVRAGRVPTLSRWIRDGTHRMAEWRPMLPATTPASQMGILHGTIDGIPAFRWVDRTTGEVLVANKPGDAALIEARHSDGRGLLADDGVSVGNLFTGDAVRAYATMSAVHRTQESREARTTVARFLARPSGLARSLSRAASEITRERFQSARARRRNVRPRVHRGWGFVMERAVLCGVLRDMNTALVADSMLQGRRSIYVDYLDYDAVAHHAGVLQPESLAALEGIDAAVAQLERVTSVAPRPYHFVVVSDHGQSQGEVFASRYGEDLAAVVRRLSQSSVVGAADNDEASSAVTAMVASSSDTSSVVGRALQRTGERLSRRSDARTSDLDPRDDPAANPNPPEAPAATDGFLVFGSGNLGLVYVAGESHRLTLTELTARFPALVPGLASHPGVGFVVVDTDEHGPVAIGAHGEHRLRDAVVVGEDPLHRFGPEAPGFVLRAASMDEAPDLYVNSLLDDLDEVAAFEGLVGCHGGLGGWQDSAVLLWPAELSAPEEMIVGADRLHRVLVGWLEDLGHRRG